MKGLKAFVSYRHTGEDPVHLLSLLTAIRDGLSDAGAMPYCTFFDEDHIKSQGWDAKDILKHAFRKLDGTDVLFVVLTTDDKSEGMLMEIGYCLAKNIPLVVAVKSTVSHTYVPELADHTFTWTDLKDLTSKIKALPPLKGAKG